MINIMLVDDHKLIREGIKQLLEYSGEYNVICEASNGEDCLAIVGDYPIDVILLDINMPVMNGIETLVELKKRKTKVKIIMLTVHNEVEYLEKAFDIGSDGYILKDSGLEVLKRAIGCVLSGETYVEPHLMDELNEHIVKKEADMDILSKLTKREVEVLKLVARGEFNKDIALSLNISERTVKNHVFNIFKKIRVSDRTQAAVFAIKNDLISI